MTASSRTRHNAGTPEPEPSPGNGSDTPAGGGKPDRAARRAFMLVAATTVALAAALSGAWLYSARQLDAAAAAAIERAGADGLSIACANRSVFGYPFRLGIHCDAIAAGAVARGWSLSAGALRTAAQIYEPKHVVAELDAPLRVETPDILPIVLDWNLARASAIFQNHGLERLSVVAENPAVRRFGSGDAAGAAGAPIARSEHFELHAQRREDSLDLALTDRAVVLSGAWPGQGTTPAFDAAADVTIDGAGAWLGGAAPGRTLGEALAGKSGTIRGLSLSAAKAATTTAVPVSERVPGVSLSGPFAVDGARRLSGTFEIAITSASEVAELVGKVDPRLEGIASTLVSAIAIAGSSENGRSVVRITITEGKASLGFIPLGKIPPLN